MAKKYLDDVGLAHLWDKIKAKITSMISNEAGKMIPYGYCQTAAATKAKVVTVSPDVTELTTGLAIAVRFQYSNTVASPTLNVNSLGAKSIYRYGTTAPSTSAASSWNANAIHILVYNGSGWVLTDWNNTTYSGMTSAEITAGTGTTNRLITPANLKTAIQTWETGEANVNADWNATSGDAEILNKPNIPTATSELTNDSDFVVDANYTHITVDDAVSQRSSNPVKSSGVYSALQGKVDTELGKGLSSNDFTTTLKNKLTGIEAGAQVNVQADWNETDSTSDAYILNKPTIPAGVDKYITNQGTYGSYWAYRVWSNGFQEVWFHGSIQFTTASSTANGWHRATKNVDIPISNMTGVTAFSDEAVVIVSGAYSGRVFTTGGIKTSGTQFEAMQLGGASMAAATISGWNVYISGYQRT